MQSNSGHHPTPLFWYLGFHSNAILNFINTLKASTHYGEYSYDVSWKKSPKLFKSTLFLYPWQLRQSLSYRFRFFLAYLVPLDVDATGNITAKLCEVWCEFNIFCTLVTMATAAILNLFNPPKAATHYGGYSYKVTWSLMKGIQNLLNPPFFISMATAAKFVQPIPIFLAYLVPLDVDVVPIKFHQFLFGE